MTCSRSFALTLPLLTALVMGCPEQGTEQGSGPKADVSCPQGFPAQCKVLKDESDSAKNTVEYHVLVPADTKHDAAQKELEVLYRHLMQRRDSEPAGLGGYVYTSEAQFSTPPASPVASVVKKPGTLAPAFENKIPLELWQQVEQALQLDKRADRKLARKLTYTADPATGKVLVTLPFTQGATAEWSPEVSFLQVMEHFSAIATALFDNCTDLKQLTYVAQWKDQDVAHIEVNRADYQKMDLHDVQEKIGSQHGRAYLEMQQQNGASEAAVSKGLNKRIADLYRKAIAPLKGQVVLSPQIK